MMNLSNSQCIIKFYLQLIKVDTINKTRITWSEKNCYPSEPIFVPRPNAQASFFIINIIIM